MRIDKPTSNDAFLKAWTIVLRANGVDLPEPECEHRFHPSRQWRFDVAWPKLKVAVEFEGMRRGVKSRHTTISGYSRDCEKYNAAAELGWTVLRYTLQQLHSDTVNTIEQVARVVTAKMTESN